MFRIPANDNGPFLYADLFSVTPASIADLREAYRQQSLNWRFHEYFF